MDAYRNNHEVAHAHLQNILRENDELRRKVLELETGRACTRSTSTLRRSSRLIAALLVAAASGGALVHALTASRGSPRALPSHTLASGSATAEQPPCPYAPYRGYEHTYTGPLPPSGMPVFD